MTMNERLIRLADKLEGVGPYQEIGPVPKNKFDMQYLGSEKRGGGSISFTDFNPKECQTAACALGWADSDPWFVKEGIEKDSCWDFWGVTTGEYDRFFFAESYPGGRLVSREVVAARLREVACGIG